MKKITTVILSLVMLVMMFPTSTVVNATEVTEEAFYCLNFQGITVDAPYLYELTTIYTPQTTDPNNPRIPSLGGVSNVAQIAAMIKADFDSRPDGTRYIQYNMLSAARAVAENIIYMDRPIQITKDWLNSFLSTYKSIGGKLDGIIVDLEYTAAESYYIWKNAYKVTNENIYSDIVNDSRYATRIRPLLVERGFKFWPDNSKPEIWGINVDVADANTEYAICRTVWDNVINEVLADAINESTYEPLIQYYPDAILSDYQRADFDDWLKPMNDYGSARVGKVSKAGNASNFNTYTNRIDNSVYGTATNPVYTKVPGYNKAVFGSEPFNMTLWDTNLFKTIYSATDTELINAWVGGYTGYWSNGHTCSAANTPYYSESMFHLGLLDPQPILGYINQSYETYDENNPNNEYNTCLYIISDILAELTRVAGFSDRRPIQTPATWNGNYVLSGMYANGRNIWRLTPNTAVKSLADFKVADSVPTFSIDGQTIMFPQGQIITGGSVRGAGTCGYWIETPADVMPVITSEADRYSKYPSFAENFEEYSVGTSFTNDTALPKACWEVTGSALSVQADGSNKALALTGTATLKNVKLPQNITAGDSYAKQQAWEVSFTLPAGLSSNAELKLLTCTNSDGGIKIADGKFYYDNAGTYQELSGVSLSAGKYTVKREVDFRTLGVFTCNYAIYNSAGNLLGEAKNIPMGSVSLPVNAIGITCTNVSGNVLLDDYKLYPTGVTTDFEIYDAQFGYKLANVNQTRTEDTAYRLSWMNTTNEEQVAYVYNEQTRTVIKEVTMTPGQDGVATGVVSAGTAGAQLSVYIGEVPEAETWDIPWIAFGSETTAKAPLEGCDPIYFKTSDTGSVTEGGSEEDYNIKLSYPLSGKPTITLNNANIISSYAGINIGRAPVYTTRHLYPVDIIVKGNNSITTTAGSSAPIKSYATRDITIRGEDGGKLNLSSYLYTGDGKHAAIRSTGSIRLENVDLSIMGTKVSSEADSFIYSDSGDITISGGTAQIITGGAGWSGDGNYPVISAPCGEISIQSGANVTVWNKRNNSTFSAGDGVSVQQSTVKVAVTHSNGSVFNAQPTLAYTNGFESAVSTIAPTAAWNTTTGLTIEEPIYVDEYNNSSWNTQYRYFYITNRSLWELPWIRIGTSLAQAPTEGSEAVYYKTDANGTVTVAGSETDYNVKLYYPQGGKPTIILNSATIAAEAYGSYGINIGSDAASTDRHDYPVDIILRGNNTINPTHGASFAIVSFATGDVTIRGENGGKLNIACTKYSGVEDAATIRTNGNLKFENANIFIQGTRATEADKFIISENGDITIDGGTFHLMTGGGSWGTVNLCPVIHALNGNIIIKNGANVNIWNKRHNNTFAANIIYIKDSTVKAAATHTNGSIFGSQPVLVFTDYDSGVSATAPTAVWDNTTGVTITAPATVGEYAEADYATYKYFSILPA